MTMIALTTAVGGGLVLLAAGIGHARRFGLLRADLVSQALLPYRWHRAVARLLVVAELTVGLAVVVSGPTLSRESGIVFAVEGGLFLVLLAYSVALLRHRPATPCGCFGDDGPVSLPSVLRTGVLAAGSVAAAVSGPPAASSPALLAAGAVVIAVLAYVVPAALRTVDTGEATWTR
jgi:Methylamine utilisation protein MauE